MEVKNFKETKGTVSCLRQPTKFFELKRNQFLDCQSKMLKKRLKIIVANAQLSVTFIWQLAGRNFGAPKNMRGSLFSSFGVLGGLKKSLGS